MAARVLIISFSDLSRDPRVRRQIASLAEEHAVTAAGLADPALLGVTYIPIGGGVAKPAWVRALSLARLLARRHEAYYWNLGYIRHALPALAGREFDLIVANDAEAWPLAMSLAGRARVLCDAHEYAPEEHGENRRWRLLYRPLRVHLCRRYLAHADGTLTVCTGLAEEYWRNFHVRPVVVRNMPRRTSLEFPADREDDSIRLIHHGWAAPNRELERMVETMELLDERFSLDFMLMGKGSAYYDKFRKICAGRPRVHLLPAIAASELIRKASVYDAGFFLLPANNTNNRHVLPNKFFEFIHSGLAVAIGPSPEMVRLAREYDFGVIAENFTPASMARALRELTPARLRQLKLNARKAAAVLNWDAESARLVSEARRLLALGPRPTPQPPP